MARRVKVKPEQGILNSIIEYLSLRKIPFVHIRNTGSINHRNGQIFFHKPKFHQRGVSDLIINYLGRAIAIEVKAPKGRLSPEQKEWLDKWQKNGGVSVVARSIDDVENAMSEVRSCQVVSFPNT